MSCRRPSSMPVLQRATLCSKLRTPLKPPASASCRRRSTYSRQSQTCASSRAVHCSSTASTFRNKESVRQAGFSLVELAVVVLIIGILAALAVPALMRSALNARSSAVMNELRVYIEKIQAYAQQHGDCPPGGGTPGTFPPGMDGYLNHTNWERVSTI